MTQEEESNVNWKQRKGCSRSTKREICPEVHMKFGRWSLAAASFQNRQSVAGSREIERTLMAALETGEKDDKTRLRALNGLPALLTVF